MSAAWTTIGVLTLATAVMKGTGPVLLGGRELPGWAVRLISLVAPALLGALVVVETLGDGKDLTIDARVAGIAAALLVLAARLSVLWAVGAAAAVATLVRLIG